MFGLFRKQDPVKEVALSLYAKAMEQSRLPWFYEERGVPDSYDGRFDCLLLHLYMIIQKLNETEEGQALAQEIFDTAVGDFDQSLREIGVGDTGMKRRMKNMMLAFNGRMHAYEAAKESGSKEDWISALERNLYGTVETAQRKEIKLVASYVAEALKSVDQQALDYIMNGVVEFPER